MTTEIILEGEKLDIWIFRRAKVDCDNQQRLVVARLPDYPMEDHQTCWGLVRFEFGAVTNGGGNRSEAILLDCRCISLLQSASRRIGRIVNMVRGIREVDMTRAVFWSGSQEVDNGITLTVTTEADLSRCANNLLSEKLQSMKKRGGEKIGNN